MACSPKRDADFSPHSFLVGLGMLERDDQPLADTLDVVAVDPHHFRPPEPTSEAGQEQRTVTGILDALAHEVQDPEQVLSQKRIDFAPGDPVRALDALQCGADDF
jgi:hypothetical protein